jgi:hypothetical protein
MSTTDICIPSLIYRSIFGWPRARDVQPNGERRKDARLLERFGHAPEA